MSTFFLRFTLESDATFGRGDGLAGAVDIEVQYDDWGCPFLGGRALKGLLVNECAEILAALPSMVRKRWEVAAQRLFGRPGSAEEDNALLAIGDAQLPEDLRLAIRYDIENKRFRPQEVLESITALRRQTAMEETGVPKEHSLRTIRVILRKTTFEARLDFLEPPSKPEQRPKDDLALLAACVKAFRRAGTGRNRGRGHLKAELLNEFRHLITNEHFHAFSKEVLK